MTDGAAEDAAGAERERRGGWVVDGGYAALVPCAFGKGWIGCERFNGSLGGGGFHDEFSFGNFFFDNGNLTLVSGGQMLSGTYEIVTAESAIKGVFKSSDANVKISLPYVYENGALKLYNNREQEMTKR